MSGPRARYFVTWAALKVCDGGYGEVAPGGTRSQAARAGREGRDAVEARRGPGGHEGGVRVAEQAIRLVGGRGILKDLPLEQIGRAHV